MKTFELYEGSVQLHFNPDAPRARYKVDDRIVGFKDESMRGVTTVLRDVIHKPELLMWPLNMACGLLEQNLNEPLTEELIKEAKSAHRAKSDRGKDIGSMAHRMVELWLNDNRDVLNTVAHEFDADTHSEEFKSAAKAHDTFVRWWNSLSSSQVLETEKAVYSRSMKYAGTYDLLAKIDGKVYMIDVKTTNRSRTAPKGVYAENFLQLGAYSYAEREERGGSVDGLAVVNVGKDGKLGIVTNEDIDVSVDFCERAFAFALRVHDWLGPVQKRLKDDATTSALNPLGEKVESPAASK